MHSYKKRSSWRWLRSMLAWEITPRLELFLLERLLQGWSYFYLRGYSKLHAMFTWEFSPCFILYLLEKLLQASLYACLRYYSKFTPCFILCLLERLHSKLAWKVTPSYALFIQNLRHIFRLQHSCLRDVSKHSCISLSFTPIVSISSLDYGQTKEAQQATWCMWLQEMFRRRNPRWPALHTPRCHQLHPWKHLLKKSQ